MSLKEIIDTLGIPVTSTIIVLILSFIKLPKVEVNLWGLISKSLVGDKLDSLFEKIESVDKKLDNHIKESDEEAALTNRHRILVFNDKLIQGEKIDKQHFDNMLFTIDRYEEYCKQHPDFPNNQCLSAIENIKITYVKKLKSKTFTKQGITKRKKK